MSRKAIAGLAAGAMTLAILVLSACAAPPHLVPGTFGWAQYTDPSLGLTVSYPDSYTPRVEGDGSYVAFRSGRFTPLIIRFVDEADGRKRGLWFGHPAAGAVVIGNIEGQQYMYRHYDGPFGVRMVACVIPWRGKYLALEFRTDGELDPVQDEVLRRAVLAP